MGEPVRIVFKGVGGRLSRIVPKGRWESLSRAVSRWESLSRVVSRRVWESIV